VLRWPLSVLSPAGRKGRLSILIFHRVLAQPDPLFPDLPTAERFDATMSWVRSWFRVLPLRDAIDQLFRGTIPSRALAITFDDGYADNESIAAPILKRLQLTATFFVSTGFLDGGCMWNDRVIDAIRADTGPQIDLTSLGLGTLPLASAGQRRRAIDTILITIKHLEPQRRQAAVEAVVAAAGGVPPPAPMMRPDQVRNLRALGMDVGAHTVSHPILTRLEPAAAFEEMSGGKRELEGMLGEPVRLFAYPNGVPRQDYAAEHAAMARECGFEAAVSTSWGAASIGSDRYQLPRFTPWDHERWRWGARLLLNLRNQAAQA
jgi:peptidoglycan/xylan/chitin deacetylase (PgdA/CDA1 family)